MGTLGRVRVLPPDTPGLPPAVPFVSSERGYLDDLACMVAIWAVDSPEVWDLVKRSDEGAYCTRPSGHPDDEIHVSRMRDEKTGEPFAIVVWGGE